jgi:3-deoxy-D-arabino-heptulosonate 7-phosphate (DAHP) synthase
MQVAVAVVHMVGQEPGLVVVVAVALAEIVLVVLLHQTELPIAVEVEVAAGSLIMQAEQVAAGSSSLVMQIFIQQQQALQEVQQSLLQVDIGYTLGLVLAL